MVRKKERKKKERENSLSSPLFSFASEYVIKTFQEDKGRPTRTWTHHLPVHVGDVSLLDENTSTMKNISLISR